MNAAIAPTLTAEPLWTRARAMFARALAALGDLGRIAALKALSPDLRRRIVAWLCPLEHIVRKLLLAEAAELHRQIRPSRLEIVPLHRRMQALRPSPRGEGEGGGVILTASIQSQRTTQAKATPHDRAQTPRTALHPTPNPLPSTGRGRAPIDFARSETWRAAFALAPPRDKRLVPDCKAPRIRALWGPTPPPPPPPPQRAPRVVNEEDSAFRLARRFEALRRVLENPLPHAQRLAGLLARAVRRFPEIVRCYLFAPARTGSYDPADPRLAIDAMSEASSAPSIITDSS